MFLHICYQSMATQIIQIDSKDQVFSKLQDLFGLNAYIVHGGYDRYKKQNIMPSARMGDTWQMPI